MDNEQNELAPEGSTLLSGQENPAPDATNVADDAGVSSDNTDDANKVIANTDLVDVAYVAGEGVELDENEQSEIDSMYAEDGVYTKLGLSSEQKQGLTDFLREQSQTSQQVQGEAFDQLKQRWADDTMKLPDFAGEDSQKNLGIARHAMDTFGSDALKTLMDEDGWGNHPEIVQFMLNVGRTLKEDNPGNIGNQTNTPKSDIEILYPTG